MLTSSGPNAEQIQYWNETAGPKWVAQRRRLDAQIRPYGLRAMERAAIAAGDRVLDIGCGCGETTLEIARRVGPRGSVTGVDISTVMLECAYRRVHAAGVTHLHFENADAQTHAFAHRAFDVAYSRFGVMFFSHPDAAFANLRAALRPDGRLAFVCWRTLQDNPWMLLPLMAAAQHVALPAPPPPGAPGPFAFADAERLRGLLLAAGFAEVCCEAVDDPLIVAGGGGIDDAVELLLQMGPAGAALRDAGPAAQPLVAAALRQALVPFLTADGVRMPAAAWIVTGRAP